MSLFTRPEKLTNADYLSIAANLLPVAGVWFFGWSPQAVFLVYCLETVLIGLFTLIKMGIVTLHKGNDTWYSGNSKTQQHGLFFMVFFILHYGIFVSIQMGIFFGVSEMNSASNVSAFNFFYKWPSLLDQDTFIMLGVFAVGYTYRLFTDFIFSGQYRQVSLMKLMFQPYGRIFIQQFTVIIGSIFLTFGAGKIFILVFAVIKIFFETYFRYEEVLDEGFKKMEKESGKQ